MTRSVMLTGLAVATCALLAACGPQPADQPTNAQGSDSPAPVTSAPATDTPATASQPTDSPSAPPGPVACDAKHVKVVAATNSGAAGTIVERFVITNTGSGSCTMDKHPFISPYGLQTQGSSKVEANLDVTVKPIPSEFGQLGVPGGKQTLAPGDTAVFFLKWSQIPPGSDPCTQADGFDFRPPQDPSSDDNLLVTFSFTPCNDELEVSEVFPPSVGS